MNLVSQVEYGKLHGVSKQAVAKWKARGLLIFVGSKVDVVESNRLLEKYRSQQSNESTNKKSTGDRLTIRDNETPSEAAERIVKEIDLGMNIEEAKRLKEMYLALLNQLKYDIESKMVVAVDEVAKAVGAEYAKVRTRLLSIPAEQAPRVNRLKTPVEVQDALQEIITEALEELTLDRVKLH